MKLNCPKCGSTLIPNPNQVGRKIQCAKCGLVLMVPKVQKYRSDDQEPLPVPDDERGSDNEDVDFDDRPRYGNPADQRTPKRKYNHRLAAWCFLGIAIFSLLFGIVETLHASAAQISAETRRGVASIANEDPGDKPSASPTYIVAGIFGFLTLGSGMASVVMFVKSTQNRNRRRRFQADNDESDN